MLYIDVKKLRIRHRLSQNDLAKLTGLSQSYICELESFPHKENPTMKTINSIAKALDVCPLELLSCNCGKCLGG